MKVLMTGGAGFIGSHTCERLLAEGMDVCAIDDLSHGRREYAPDGVKFYEADIRDAGAVDKIFEAERPGAVVHLAAQIKPHNSIVDPAHDAQVNIIGSINLLEAARKSGVKKIIYAASAAIFGEPAYLPIDEAHPLDMISGYGVSKHTVEHYLSVYNKLYGMGYNILRYSNVFGPRQDSTGEGGVIAIFSETFAKGGVPTVFGDGEQVRDFVYVKDVTEANLLALRSDKNGIYNVCTGEKVTVNRLVDTFNIIYGVSIKPNYTAPRDGDILVSYMTYAKIQAEMGWAPKYAFADALRETAAYYGG